MQKIRRIIYLTALGTAGLLIFLINPLLMLLASISLLAFIAVARQLNFYKIAMMIKRYAATVSRLRFEIRAKLHTGFRDYSSSLENEKSHSKSYGYVR